MNRWGNPKRTQADKVAEAMLFVHNARDHIVMDLTADKVCAMKGVTKREDQRRIEAALVARQAAIRRGAA